MFLKKVLFNKIVPKNKPRKNKSTLIPSKKFYLSRRQLPEQLVSKKKEIQTKSGLKNKEGCFKRCPSIKYLQKERKNLKIQKENFPKNTPLNSLCKNEGPETHPLKNEIFLNRDFQKYLIGNQ